MKLLRKLLIVRRLIDIYFKPLYHTMRAKYSKNEKAYLEQLGSRIREFRIGANLSQEKLAFACNLDRTYIGSVERGERNVSVINLRKIANALKIKVPLLLNIEE